MLAELDIIVHSHKAQRLMTPPMIQVCVPTGIAQSGVVAHIAEPCSLFSVLRRNNSPLWNSKDHILAVTGRSQPQPVFFD